jgi:virginiamycin B lyase
MRLVITLCVSLAIASHLWCAEAPDEKPKKTERSKGKRPAGALLGIKTPGVQIPMAGLKSEAELPVPSKPDWIFFSESIYIPNKGKSAIEKIDPKTNKPGEPITGLSNPCSGMAAGFGSLWVPVCGDGSLVRLDSKTLKVVATLATGTAAVPDGIAVNADSVWLLTDTKTTLSRIDPEQNQVVSELRVPAGCKSVAFGEAALWLACPSEDKVLRIDPATNLVDKRIEVSAQPESLAIGEGSIWVFCRKAGNVDRIDPKTFKVSKSIELGVPGVEGRIAVGEGSVWVTLSGFPITRINPQSEQVAQQFSGSGGGVIYTSPGAIWLSNINQGTVWRIDPKRIAATLAE